MSLDADQIVERRRLKRSRALWRFATFAALILLVVAGSASLGVSKFSFGAHVARLKIEGIIFDDETVIQAIDRIAENDSAEAVMVVIDSPGGTVTGSEAVYKALRRVSAKKPVVTVMGSLAASGGYVVALSADHIVAGRNTITGSIGVVMQAIELSGLMEKIGVSVNEIKSAPLKGEPSEFHPITPEARKATEVLVADAYDWFVGLVRERRKFTAEQAKAVSDGRVFSGKQALAVKLVDELGDEKTARAWLAEQYNVSERLPVRDVDTAGEIPGFGSAENRALAALSLLLTGKSLDSKRLTLDGLVAIWHPAH